MVWMNARYAGRCRCGAQFAVSETINYDRDAKQVVYCPTCSPYNQSLNGERSCDSSAKLGARPTSKS